jgi:hypothetical protein
VALQASYKTYSSSTGPLTPALGDNEPPFFSKGGFWKKRVSPMIVLNAGRERDRMTGQKQGLIFKAGGTALEGQPYEFMTGHDTIVSMGDELKE